MTATPFVARNPTDLIAIAPHVIGFHPRDSVVLMTFGSPGGAFHARVDLPVEAEAHEEVADLLVGAVLRNHLDTAAVLIFSADAEASRAQGSLLVARLCGAGVDVVDVLRVEPERYFHPLEDDDEGTPYDVSGHPFTAQRVYEGEVVQPSREALADTLVGTDDDDLAAVTAAAAAFGATVDQAHPGGPCRLGRAEALWVRARVRRNLRDGRPLAAAEVGQMLVCCGSVNLRDVAWAEMTRSNAGAHVELWRDLVRRSPGELRPPVAALLAFAAWLDGDGALSWCAIEKCLENDPDYSLAHLIATMLTGAVPPSTWPGIVDADLAVLARDARRRAG